MKLESQALFPPYPLADQRGHEPDLSSALRRVLDSGNYILGDEGKTFEREFAAFLGVRHIVSVASGTDAIEVLLRALGIGHGARVVIPAFAPSAVAAAVVRSGALPLMADVEADTFTLCAESLEAVLCSSLGHEVKAVLAVHLFGHPADWQNLLRVAATHGVVLLEDGAQAHGATWHGSPVGSLGAAAAFSFYPTKNLAALGDGGAVATDDEDLAARLRHLREYGWRVRGNSETPGVNSRLDELQAAILRVKLPMLAQRLDQRRRLAAQYDARLSTCALVRVPVVRGGCEHARHQYVVRCEERDALLEHLQSAGVPAAIHYAVPLHRQSAWREDVSLPEAERASQEVLSLPLHPYLSEAAVDFVCQIIEEHAHAGS